MVTHIKIENSVFGTFGPLVSCVFWIIKQIHKPFRTSSNEHSSQQVWIQLAQWFQGRRLKCKSLGLWRPGWWRQMEAKWWQYLTWSSGSDELTLLLRATALLLEIPHFLNDHIWLAGMVSHERFHRIIMLFFIMKTQKYDKKRTRKTILLTTRNNNWFNSNSCRLYYY